MTASLSIIAVHHMRGNAEYNEVHRCVIILNNQ